LYLIDTNVISAAAPSKHAAPAELIGWMEASSDLLFLSVVTAAEVEDGITKAFREGARQKAESLSGWWNFIEHVYGARILPIDLDIAHAVGRLLDRARAAGHAPGFADVAIAATAQVHGHTILTRNVKHFSPLGVPVVNPFEMLPAPPAGR
jgi:toxin FitB